MGLTFLSEGCEVGLRILARKMRSLPRSRPSVALAPAIALSGLLALSGSAQALTIRVLVASGPQLTVRVPTTVSPVSPLTPVSYTHLTLPTNREV